jgi:hypothetical protein
MTAQLVIDPRQAPETTRPAHDTTRDGLPWPLPVFGLPGGFENFAVDTGRFVEENWPSFSLGGPGQGAG